MVVHSIPRNLFFYLKDFGIWVCNQWSKWPSYFYKYGANRQITVVNKLFTIFISIFGIFSKFKFSSIPMFVYMKDAI